MLLGLETFSYHLAFGCRAMDVLGFIDRTAELGLDGVQINVVGRNWGHLGGAAPEHLDAVRRRCRELGLYVELDTRGTSPDHLRAVLAVCDALGADVLRTYASVGGDVRGELARAVGDLKQVVPVCAAFGVRIAFENHEYETAADVIAVIEAVGSEWVGALVDTGNAMMVWEDPVAAVRALAPYAASTHFKDHVVMLIDGEPRVVGTTVGRGSIDGAACFQALAADSPLQRINIECCYGYQAPFRRAVSDGAGARLGQGAFRIIEPPVDPEVLDPSHLGERHAEPDLLALHDRSVVASVDYVKRLNAEHR